MTENQINRLLWQVDPMSTGCNVNEGMENEYEALAKAIAGATHAGVPPRQAVLMAFDESFWPGCLQEAHRQPALADLVAALSQP